MDHTSPRSYSGVGGFATFNGSWGIGAAQKLFLQNDRYRVLAAASLADIDYHFFGIGTDAAMAGDKTSFDQRGYGGLGQFLFHTGDRWYTGLQYHIVRTKVNFDGNRATNPVLFVPRIGRYERTGAFGPHIERDSRNDVNYPRAGSLLNGTAGFYGKAAGGQFGYQSYEISYSKYAALGTRGVLAARGSGCYINGDVPFYDLCLIGLSRNLRGYEPSRYRDRRMVVGQAEYRRELPKRFGAVAFAGVGEVGPSFGDFKWDSVLPGGGVGLRYRLTRESHINLRVDYAVGRGDHEFYFYIGEAF